MSRAADPRPGASETAAYNYLHLSHPHTAPGSRTGEGMGPHAVHRLR